MNVATLVADHLPLLLTRPAIAVALVAMSEVLVEMLPVFVAMLEVLVAMLPVFVAMLEVLVAMFVTFVAMFPVLIAVCGSVAFVIKSNNISAPINVKVLLNAPPSPGLLSCTWFPIADVPPPPKLKVNTS